MNLKPKKVIDSFLVPHRFCNQHGSNPCTENSFQKIFNFIRAPHRPLSYLFALGAGYYSLSVASSSPLLSCLAPIGVLMAWDACSELAKSSLMEDFRTANPNIFKRKLYFDTCPTDNDRQSMNFELEQYFRNRKSLIAGSKVVFICIAYSIAKANNIPDYILLPTLSAIVLEHLALEVLQANRALKGDWKVHVTSDPNKPPRIEDLGRMIA